MENFSSEQGDKILGYSCSLLLGFIFMIMRTKCLRYCLFHAKVFSDWLFCVNCVCLVDNNTF